MLLVSYQWELNGTCILIPFADIQLAAHWCSVYRIGYHILSPLWPWPLLSEGLSLSLCSSLTTSMKSARASEAANQQID